MNNLKKLSILILIVSMIIMAGCVSAVDDDAYISSESSSSDLALDECQLENSDESDVLASVPDDSAIASDALGSVPDDSAIASDAFDDDKLGDETPKVDIHFAYPDPSGIYRENVDVSLIFFVYDAPVENLDVKITLDGLELENQDPYYGDGYSFNPATGELHIDRIEPSSYIAYNFGIYPIATRVGDATVQVEWESNSEPKQMSQIIPITMGEADLEIRKSTTPFNHQLPYFPIDSPDEDATNKSVGDIIVWYVSVRNFGPNTAFDIDVKDVVPDGMLLDSVEIQTGSEIHSYEDYDFSDMITIDYSEIGAFHIPKILYGQYVDFIIRSHATTPGIKTNVAKVSSETPDGDTTNNEGNATVIVEGDEPSNNETDESEDDNSTDEEPKDDATHDDEGSSDDGTVLSVGKDYDEVVSKSVGTATGNPVFLALIALMIVTQSIFRRKK